MDPVSCVEPRLSEIVIFLSSTPLDVHIEEDDIGIDSISGYHTLVCVTLEGGEEREEGREGGREEGGRGEKEGREGAREKGEREVTERRERGRP